MPEKQNPSGRDSDGPRTYPGEKVRQGEIILRKPWQRAVFIFGLALPVILLLLLLVMRWVDLHWLALPALSPEGPAFHWLDAATAIALGGLWLSAFAGRLARRPLLPIRDPFLPEALAHD